MKISQQTLNIMLGLIDIADIVRSIQDIDIIDTKENQDSKHTIQDIIIQKIALMVVRKNEILLLTSMKLITQY